MTDFFNSKFESRVWLGVLLIVITIILSVVGDQSTFVREPRNDFETMLTILPVITYQLVMDRTTCFVLDLAAYGFLLGVGSYGILIILERLVFEPLFFKRMIQTKLREEKLFNQYMNDLKP